MSQRDTVASLLRQWGGLDDATARQNGIGQLRTRVLELRRQGWRIETCTDVYVGTSTPACTGHYVLLQAPGEPPRQPVLWP